MKRVYRGINYDLYFNRFYRVKSEIGNFYGQTVTEALQKFHEAINKREVE